MHRSLKSKRFRQNKENTVDRIHVAMQTIAKASAGKAALVAVDTSDNVHHFVQVGDPILHL